MDDVTIDRIAFCPSETELLRFAEHRRGYLFVVQVRDPALIPAVLPHGVQLERVQE